MSKFVKPLDEHIILRNMRLMEPSPDLIVVILRGHLLVEEMLRRILQKHAVDPAALEDARLTFFQVLRMVQAIAAHPGRVDLWKELEQLNRIRNILAHQSEPTDIEKTVDAFLEDFTQRPASTPEERALILFEKMHVVLGSLWQILEASPGTEGDFLIHGCPL